MARKRSASEILKRGYSEDELTHIYELARFFIQSGDLQRADTILRSIVEVAPEHINGWLGLCYLALARGRSEDALAHSRHAMELEPSSVEAMLFLVTASLSRGDLQTAGTYLGEVGDLIEAGKVDNRQLERYYRGQLARYQVCVSQ